MPLRPTGSPVQQRRRAGDDRLAVENALQIVGEILRRGVAIVAAFRHAFHNDGLQVRRQLGLQKPRRARVLPLDVPQQGLSLIARNGRLQRQQLVERGAQGIDVRAMVDQGHLAAGLLGAHVAHRAHQVAGARQRGVGLAAGQAEVRDPELAVAVQQQIGGLDVAMHDAALMGCVQRTGRVDAQAGDAADIFAAAGRPRGQGRALRCARTGGFSRNMSGIPAEAGTTSAGHVPLAHFGDDPIQRLAVDELHRVVMDAALHSHCEDGNDVRMVQLSGGLGLMLEAGDLPAVEHGRKGEHFQGDASAQRNLLGLVDHAHTTAADLPQQAKIAQSLLIARGRQRVRPPLRPRAAGTRRPCRAVRPDFGSSPARAPPDRDALASGPRAAAAGPFPAAKDSRPADR